MNQFLTTCRIALVASALIASAAAHATFSIVAFDPNTREVGSAMATCVSNIDLGFFASRFAPGQGAINAQSFASVPNLLNGRERLLMGDSAQETLDFLLANDVNNDPQSRQYLIVDLGDNAFDHSVTFSGADNFAFAGGVDGDNYAIAGNILSGEDIILQMETAFLNTDGWLGEKLMAALQGPRNQWLTSVARRRHRCRRTSA
ncbi:MAG: DUF1028 domain-containing protein [Gammaproteobacteria bacterium]